MMYTHGCIIINKACNNRIHSLLEYITNRVEGRICVVVNVIHLFYK